MSNALIGIFDDPAAAASARERLIAAGVPEGDVMLHVNDASELADRDSTRGVSETDPGASALGEIFSSLFDMDGSDRRTGRLADAIRTGGYLLLVKADDAHRTSARSIIEDCGAIDVREMG